mgnify:CR=1 FL=1
MPWSALLYEKQILKEILNNTVNGEITNTALYKIMMRETKMTSNKSISNSIHAFETLGYIKSGDDGIHLKVNMDEIDIRLIKLEKEK